MTRQSLNGRQTPSTRFGIRKPTTSAGPTAPTQVTCCGGALCQLLCLETLQSNIVVTLLIPAAPTAHSLAPGTVLERCPLRSAALQSTVVVDLSTPASLTVQSPALGAATAHERPQCGRQAAANVDRDCRPLSTGSAVAVWPGDCRCGCQPPRHSLLRKNCIKKVVQGRKASRPLSTPFPVCNCANEQTIADDCPDWLETTTSSCCYSVLPPMAVVHLQFELRRLRTLVARLLHSFEI